MRSRHLRLKKLLSEAKRLETIAAQATVLANRASQMATSFRSVAQKLQAAVRTKVGARIGTTRARWLSRRPRR